MNKKVIIILIIAIIAVIGGYFIFANNMSSVTTNQTTIILSKSAYMEVPQNSNATSNADKNGIFYYKDNKDDINITSCSNLSAPSSVNEMKKLKNSFVTGAKKIKENDIVIYEKNGTYSAFIANTQYNDTLLIQSSDKNLLILCLNSVKYHNPTDKIDFNNTSGSGSGSVVSAIEKTETAVQSNYASTGSSSSSSSTSTQSSSSGSGSGGGGYSDFGFGGSSSSSSRSSRGSGEGGYSDFGFD